MNDQVVKASVPSITARPSAAEKARFAWLAERAGMSESALALMAIRRLLEPDANEREGYVPNVVYSCGGVVHNRALIIPYAMSDYASTFATVSLDEVLDAMVRL